MTQRDRWQGRKCVQGYYDFKDELRLQWGNEQFPSPHFLGFFLPMPRSWSKKKKRLMYGTPHLQRPDIDNMQKAVMDCLLSEDSHIYGGMEFKFWAEEGLIFIAHLEEVMPLLQNKNVPENLFPMLERRASNFLYGEKQVSL